MELSRLAKFATCPVRERHWFVPWLKSYRCSVGKVLISLFRNPTSGETRTVGVSQKKSCRRLNLLANIGSLIAKAHQLNYSWPIYYVSISIEQKFAPFTSFSSMYSSYINALPEPSAQRRMTLKANPSLTFGIAIWNKVTFGASTFDEPQPRSLALL